VIHDIPFYHHDIRWNNVIHRIDDLTIWFLIDWEDAASSPTTTQKDFRCSSHSPAIFQDCHGAEVDIWAVGHLITTCFRKSQVIRMQTMCGVCNSDCS
jgi:hypothetical protein